MNNNNPFNDLPKRVDEENNELPEVKPSIEENNNSSSTEENKPIIEIPQEYYDKLDRERRAKELEEQERLEKRNQINEIKKESNKMLTLTLLNAAIVFGLLFLTLKVNELFLFLLPVAVIILSIFEALKDKELSNYPASILIGGMVTAVVTFVLSMIFEENMDMWTYYAIASAATAFLGLIIANTVTKIISKPKEIKALETVGYIVFFCALIGVPAFLYIKYPEQFYKYVYQRQGEVHAETEDEFIIKTLKNRYGKNFTCPTQFKTHIYSGTTTFKERKCKDDSGKEVVVQSIAYSQIDNKYIIIDNYTDTLFLDTIRDSVSTKISGQVENVRTVITYLYPKKDCKFVGDCVECDEYYENYGDDIGLDALYKASSELNFEKSMSQNPLNFVNNNKFKVVLNIIINSDVNMGDDYYNKIIVKALNSLNELEIKNNFGYQITINRWVTSEGVTMKDYVVKGDASSEGFINPKVVK